MRKYAMKILEILHGGMLLAAIYCIVMQQVTDDIRMLLRGLYLLIPCAVLSVARPGSGNSGSFFWQRFWWGPAAIWQGVQQQEGSGFAFLLW